MKVCLLIGASLGIGRYGLMLAKALDKVVDLKVVIPENLLEDDFISNWVKDLHCISYVKPRDTGVYRAWKNIRSVRKQIAYFEPDIIHDTAGTAYFSNILFLRFPKGAKYVYTEHEPVERHAAKNSKKNIYTALLKKYADAVIVHGPYCLQLVVDDGFVASSVKIIPHGVYDYYYEMENESVVRDASNVLFFGELRPDKGIDTIITLSDYLAEQHLDATFTVAGKPQYPGGDADSAWAQRLDDILSTLKAKDSIKVIDQFIPDEEVSSLFRKASVVILPYKSATQSGVATIGMAFSCCVLAYDRGDLGALLDDGRTGMLVEPDNIDEFCHRLETLIQQPEKAREIGDRARAFADQNLGWNTIAAHHLEQYEQIVGEDES